MRAGKPKCRASNVTAKWVRMSQKDNDSPNPYRKSTWPSLIPGQPQLKDWAMLVRAEAAFVIQLGSTAGARVSALQRERAQCTLSIEYHKQWNLPGMKQRGGIRQGIIWKTKRRQSFSMFGKKRSLSFNKPSKPTPDKYEDGMKTHISIKCWRYGENLESC